MSTIDNRRFDENGRTYYWSGGFGAVVKSFERGVSIGDIRVIAGNRLYVYLLYPRRFRASEVCWTFEKPTIERIRDFRRHVFGVDCAPLSASEGQ
jgi:hypothetical protein